MSDFAEEIKQEYLRGVAFRMIRGGESDEDITEITDIPTDQVRKLRHEAMDELKKEVAVETKKECAKEMISDGALTDQRIARYTGLTNEQIRELHEEAKGSL